MGGRGGTTSRRQWEGRCVPCNDATIGLRDIFYWVRPGVTYSKVIGQQPVIGQSSRKKEETVQDGERTASQCDCSTGTARELRKTECEPFEAGTRGLVWDSRPTGLCVCVCVCVCVVNCRQAVCDMSIAPQTEL
jgi:hypothetical protein